MAKLEVGQKLLLEWYGRDFDVTVEKVGRKYATIGNPQGFHEPLRLDMSDMYVTWMNGRGGGRCYLSPADRDAAKEANRRRMRDFDAWDKFRRALPHSKPETATAERIYEAAALLGVEMPERASAGAPDSKGDA